MTDETVSDLSCADTLWKAADALRGQVDAAEYKHVVLGLLFLKYISDSFQSRRDELQAELTKDGITGKQLESLLESRDEYTAERVFIASGDLPVLMETLSHSPRKQVVITGTPKHVDIPLAALNERFPCL